jgi:hypothetical protein
VSTVIALICKPGSSKPGLSVEDGVLHLRVRERAIEGAANEACIKALADALGVPRSHVRLFAGARARQKRFAVEGIDDAEARAKLGLSG